MKKILLIIVIAVAGWAVYTYVLAPDSAGVEVTLAEQNDSGERGVAVLEDVNGQLRVTLTVQGQPAGVRQPAHIHSGTCADIGGVVYPLTFPTDGGSVTSLDIALDDLRTGGPYAINVHQSTDEPQIYVACGDISL